MLMLYSMSGIASKLAAGTKFLSFKFCLCYGVIILLAYGVMDQSHFHVIADHGTGDLHAAKRGQTPVDILCCLLQVESYVRQMGVPRQPERTQGITERLFHHIIHGLIIFPGKKNVNEAKLFDMVGFMEESARRRDTLRIIFAAVRCTGNDSKQVKDGDFGQNHPQNTGLSLQIKNTPI